MLGRWTTHYRHNELLRMVDDHDARLRAIVGLAKREGLKGGSTQRISVQLAHLLLRWCGNTRDAHLLRAVPRRLIGPVAERHDQSVKVACAAIMGLRPQNRTAGVATRTHKWGVRGWLGAIKSSPWENCTLELTS